MTKLIHIRIDVRDDLIDELAKKKGFYVPAAWDIGRAVDTLDGAIWMALERALYEDHFDGTVDDLFLSYLRKDVEKYG